MTHLKIEQNNGVTEEVSSEVIEKLYNIVHDNLLDNTSNLIGRLHTSATYQDYIDYLEDAFKVGDVKLLIIDATKKYMSFVDPVILRILSTTYGDGTGVTLSELLNVSNIPNVFKGNTTILIFNEFLYFTGIIHRNISNTDDWFNGCTNLREITIPKNIESLLPDTMFNGCTSLETINFTLDCCITTLPSFAGCSSLSSITIPDSVTAISSFQLTALTTIDTNNVTVLPNGIFRGLSSLTSVNLPNITLIGLETFANCTNLATIIWDNLKITKIGADAFPSCNKLVINDLNLPNLITLGGDSFPDTKVKQVSNLGSITSINSWTFSRCPLTSIVLPNTVTTIGEAAFYECTSLPSIDLLNVTTLSGGRHFYGCTSLATVNNINNLTAIPNEAFRGCSALTSINLNNGISIGNYVFENDTSLTLIFDSSVTSASITFSDTGVYTFSGCTHLEFPLTLTISANSNSSGTGGGWLFYAFNNVGMLHDVILDSSVKGVSLCAFRNSNLTSITAPYLEGIGDLAFSGVNATIIDLPSLLNYCLSYNVYRTAIFSNCPNLLKVILGHFAGTIGSNSDYGADGAWFYNTPNIKYFDVGDSLTEYLCNIMGGNFRGSNASLEKFIIRNTTVPTLNLNNIPSNYQTAATIITNFGGSSVKIYVPDSALNDYKTATNWSIIASYIYPLSDIES